MIRTAFFSLMALAMTTQGLGQEKGKSDPDQGKLRRPAMIEFRTDPPGQVPEKVKDKEADTDGNKKKIVVYLPSEQTTTKMPSAVMAGDFPRSEGYQKVMTVENTRKTIPRPSGKNAYKPGKPTTLRKPTLGRFPTNYDK